MWKVGSESHVGGPCQIGKQWQGRDCRVLVKCFLWVFKGMIPNGDPSEQFLEIKCGSNMVAKLDPEPWDGMALWYHRYLNFSDILLGENLFDSCGFANKTRSPNPRYTKCVTRTSIFTLELNDDLVLGL
jgi:hypothetical protein